MTASRIAAQLIACLVLASVCFGQGIQTKRGAVVLFGSAINCSRPSTIRYKLVQKATPEWRTLKTERVKKESARYDLLTSEMNSRIKTAVASVAQAESRDCVVRTGDIEDAGGLTVADLTDAVIDELDRSGHRADLPEPVLQRELGRQQSEGLPGSSVPEESEKTS
jgi:hypothetical protein